MTTTNDTKPQCDRCRAPGVCECEAQAAAGQWCLRHDLPRIHGERTCWRCEADDDGRTEAAYRYSHESQNDMTTNDVLDLQRPVRSERVRGGA